MAQLPHPDSRPARNPGDGWVECRCGAQHWGLFGAAGLLLAAAEEAVTGPSRTGVPRVLLQHRALWSHHGGTWGIPGGALAPGEAPVDGALREAVEEAGVPDHTVRVWACSVLRHPDWAYTTVVGEATQPFHPHAGDGESLEVAWVRAEDVTDRPLLPAFGAAWAEQARLVGRHLALVVDAANVIGSRPDGWWRDRPGAAARLHGRLAAALPAGLPAGALGLPADRWWPDVHLVLEGRAREAPVPPGPVGPPVPAPAPAVRVIRAPRDGDDEVVAVARAALAPGAYSDVVVVTADRALAARVRADGAGVVGPGALLAAV